MPLEAKLAFPTRNGRVDRHPLAVFLPHGGKLMAQHQGLLQPGIADARFAEPVQVGAAHAHRRNPQPRLAFGQLGNRLIVLPQVA